MRGIVPQRRPKLGRRIAVQREPELANGIETKTRWPITDRRAHHSCSLTTIAGAVLPYGWSTVRLPSDRKLKCSNTTYITKQAGAGAPESAQLVAIYWTRGQVYGQSITATASTSIR
jgi:hypothetical protein